MALHVVQVRPCVFRSDYYYTNGLPLKTQVNLDHFSNGRVKNLNQAQQCNSLDSENVTRASRAI